MDNSSEPKKLPPSPSLEHLQKQAKRRVKENPSLQLAAAQHQIAQEYGFANWAELAQAIMSSAKAQAAPSFGMSEQLNQFIGNTDGGASAVLILNGKTTLHAAGNSGKNDARPVTAQTVFEAGSLTKVFTALLLAESERQGKVNRLDAAAKYLVPPNDSLRLRFGHITFLSLANHTSGLPREPMPPVSKSKYWAIDETTGHDAIWDHLSTVVSRPSDRFVYSNLGYAFLGHAIAAAWGREYSELIGELIIGALGMRSTSLRHGVGAPAGGLRTTAEDIGIFLSAALGKIDSPLKAAFEATLQPQTEDHTTGGFVGLGWMLMSGTPGAIAWHNGAILRNRAFMGMNPRSGEAVALLTNTSKSPDSLGFAALKCRPPRPRPEQIADAKAYVGYYPVRRAPNDQVTFAVEIREHRGGLYAKTTHSAEVSLRRNGPDRFVFGETSYEIEFERDAAGNVVSLLWMQRANRQLPPKPPPVVILSAAELDEYPGRYAITPTHQIAVVRQENSLLVQLTGHAPTLAVPSAKDRFHAPAIPADFHFRRDESGKVSGLVYVRSGRHLTATKMG